MADQQPVSTPQTSLTVTVAYTALLLGVLNTVYIVQNLSQSPNRVLLHSGEYATMRESVGQLRADVESLNKQVGTFAHSADDLALRQALVALETVARNSEGATAEDAASARKGIERVLMRFKGLEPPVDAPAPAPAEATALSPEMAMDEVLEATADVNATIAVPAAPVDVPKPEVSSSLAATPEKNETPAKPAGDDWSQQGLELDSGLEAGEENSADANAAFPATR